MWKAKHLEVSRRPTSRNSHSPWWQTSKHLTEPGGRWVWQQVQCHPVTCLAGSPAQATFNRGPAVPFTGCVIWMGTETAMSFALLISKGTKA